MYVVIFVYFYDQALHIAYCVIDNKNKPIAVRQLVCMLHTLNVIVVSDNKTN